MIVACYVVQSVLEFVLWIVNTIASYIKWYMLAFLVCGWLDDLDMRHHHTLKTLKGTMLL